MSGTTGTTPQAPTTADLRGMSDFLSQLQVKGQWVLISPSGAIYATDNANDMMKVLIPHSDIGRIK